MANISKIEIAKEKSNSNILTVKKGFLGFGGKIVLNDTGATLRPIVREYAPAEGDKLLRIINLDSKAIADALSSTELETTGMGNVRLEALLAEDGTCLLMQMFRYADFKCKPISDLKVIQGKEAEVVGKLL